LGYYCRIDVNVLHFHDADVAIAIDADYVGNTRLGSTANLPLDQEDVLQQTRGFKNRLLELFLCLEWGS